MPEIGEIKRGREINQKGCYTKFCWCACQDCGKKRWVRLLNGKPKHSRCNVCTSKLKQVLRHSANWQPRTLFKNGYISVRLYEDDFFYPMTRKDGYVFEHRLVVAKALGRCLHDWEIVHHLHDKYPAGSVEDKQDNRYPENLQLVSDLGHNQITILERRINYLEQRVTLLEAENALLRLDTSNALLPRG